MFTLESKVKNCNPECCHHCLTGYLPATLTLHTYFNSLNSRLGDLGHLGLGDGRLVLIQWVQLGGKKNKNTPLNKHGMCFPSQSMSENGALPNFPYHDSFPSIYVSDFSLKPDTGLISWQFPLDVTIATNAEARKTELSGINLWMWRGQHQLPGPALLVGPPVWNAL